MKQYTTRVVIEMTLDAKNEKRAGELLNEWVDLVAPVLDDRVHWDGITGEPPCRIN